MNFMINYRGNNLVSVSFFITLLHFVEGLPNDKEEDTSVTNKLKITNTPSFIEDIKTRGENILMKELPDRITQLTELLEQPEWKEQNMINLHADLNIPIPDPATRDRDKQKTGIEASGNAKVYLFSNGMALSNDKMINFKKRAKALTAQMLKDANVLKLWITFMVPKIEDGSNFGVAVQNAVMRDIKIVKKLAVALYARVSGYHGSRADIISKAAKFPHVEDYRRAVNEYDERHYFLLNLNLTEIRDNYASLYDILVKNKEKLMKPRSSIGYESVY